jgi:6-phosphogluconate dehydrogenase
MDIGIIGLGRMGAGVGERLRKGGHTVVAYNRTLEKTQAFAQEHGAVAAESLRELVEKLPAPRTVWLYLPAGQITDEHLLELAELLQPGDVVLDGGNSNFSLSASRAQTFAQKGIDFMDVGTSGGIAGREVGYCLMIGGSQEQYDRLQPAWSSVAQEGGWQRTGPVGSGHYVKMVHNAVEYGMMQAYGEGMQLLTDGSYAGQLNLPEIADLWEHGSIVRSYLGSLLRDALNDDSVLASVQGVVADSGEGRWSVEEALQYGVPVPVFTAALFARYSSRQVSPMSAKVVAVLRTKFGGHATNPGESIRFS